MGENMRDIDNPSSNMPTKEQRALKDYAAEWRLNNLERDIQTLKNDLEKDIQTVKDDLEKDIQTLKNDLEKDIDEIKTRLTSIDCQLQNVKNNVSELKGRRLAVKEWIPIGCSVIALIVSIITLYFHFSSAPQQGDKGLGLEPPMILDMNVFEKNPEFITQAAEFIEHAIKVSYGCDIADCPWQRGKCYKKAGLPQTTKIESPSNLKQSTSQHPLQSPKVETGGEVT